MKVKTIGLIRYALGILCLSLLWGLVTPGAACMKSSNRLAAAILPPAKTDSSLPAVTDTASDATSHTYLALGDSYTIGQSVDITDRYPVQAVRLLKTDHLNCQPPEIIAETGWTTVNLINALAVSPPVLSTLSPVHYYNVVTLLIGVNDQYQGGSQSEYREYFTNLLRQSIALAGNLPSHVIVLSIPDYSVTPFAHGHNTTLIAAQIDSFNSINYSVSQDYQAHYLDITAESRKAAGNTSLIASDGLHFSGKEYAIWAQMMEPVMKGILK